MELAIVTGWAPSEVRAMSVDQLGHALRVLRERAERARRR